MACRGGLRRKGTWVQPPGLGARQVHRGKKSHFPFSATGQAHVAGPLSTPVSACVVLATGHTDPPQESSGSTPKSPPPRIPRLLVQMLKPVSVLFLCVYQFLSI